MFLKAEKYIVIIIIIITTIINYGGGRGEEGEELTRGFRDIAFLRKKGGMFFDKLMVFKISGYSETVV